LPPSRKTLTCAARAATYDAWIRLAADSHARLASRDRRAEATYRRFGVEVEMVT